MANPGHSDLMFSAPSAAASSSGAAPGHSDVMFGAPTGGKGYKPKKQGGGVLRSVFHNPVTHALGQTVTDLKDIAVNAPAGVYQAASTFEHDLTQNPGFLFNPTSILYSPSSETFQKVIKPTVTQTKTDLQHPLRHPGYTLLDVLGAAGLAGSVVGKAGEVARAAKAGESAGQLATRLVTKTVPEARVTSAKGVTVRLGNYSQSPAARFAQRYIDQLRQRFPDTRIGVLTHTQRVGRALEKQRQTEFKLATAPATGLKIAGKTVKQNSPEGLALRAVAEGTPLELMQQTWREDLLKAKSATARKNLNRQIQLAEKAKPLVAVDQAGNLRIADPKLAALYEKTKSVALATDQSILRNDLMAPETVAGSISKPGQQYRAAADFTGGQFHVGYERRSKPFAATKQPRVGSANTVGIPNKPGRFRQSTFTNLHEGAFRNDVPSLVADNAIETERYAALLRARQFFIDHAQPTPEGMRNPVAIRTDQIGRRPFDRVIKDFQDQQRQVRQAADHTFNPMGVGYEKTREEIFPQIDPTDFAEHPEVKWIEDPLLGGLNKPGPLATAMQHTSTRRALRITDAINNAQKFAILYLKPAYAVPNMVGNAFLTLVQQGWAAPANLTRSARLAAKIGPEDAGLIRDLMGEGIGASLESRTGITAKLNTVAARRVFEPLVDTPFRLASFLYEARRELGLHGTMNSADWTRVHTLLHDENLRPQLHDVVARANKAIIDYGDLTPVEQSIIRRIVFFYPWLKGSTRYAGTFLTEHPVLAGAAGQTGQEGRQFSQNQLGPLPSWAEGYFKVGGSTLQPEIVNPTSAGILSQPGQLAEAVNEFLSSPNPRSAYTLASNLTPFLAAANTTLSGKDQFTGRNVPQNAGTFIQQALGLNPEHPLNNPSLPLLTLISRLREGQQTRTFPVTDMQAILQFLLGGVAPKNANRPKLNAAAAAEQKPVSP